MVRVKLKRIETSTCSIFNIRLSTSIFGLPMILTEDVALPTKNFMGKKANLFNLYGSLNIVLMFLQPIKI